MQLSFFNHNLGNIIIITLFILVFNIYNYCYRNSIAYYIHSAQVTRSTLITLQVKALMQVQVVWFADLHVSFTANLSLLKRISM